MFGVPFIFQIFFVVVYFLGGLVNVDLKIHPHQKMSTSRYCGLQLPALMLIVASYSVLVATNVHKCVQPYWPYSTIGDKSI